jgi:Domain of unknown function (DUF1707)
MSYQNERRTRGFGPILGGMGYPDQNMRVSDAERQAVADRLAVHYGDGRLDQAEFDERASRAMSAKTRADLDGILDDLPEPGLAGAPGVPRVPGMPVRRHRHGHSVITLALVVVIALAAVHAVMAFTVPWLWLGFVALVLLAATGHLGHHRPRADVRDQD